MGALPNDWQPNIVSGRGQDLTQSEGPRIFTECLERVAGLDATLAPVAELVREDAPRFGEAMLVKPRLGQDIFRAAVLDAYSRACAVTGEHSLPVLEAAHIKPYRQGGEHAITNGITLRSDIRQLSTSATSRCRRTTVSG